MNMHIISTMHLDIPCDPNLGNPYFLMSYVGLYYRLQFDFIHDFLTLTLC